MIYEFFIGAGALLVLWWTLPFIFIFGVLIIAALFFAAWLFIEWAMGWRIFNKKWWKNVFN